MRVRPEESSDIESVRRVHAEAFARPGQPDGPPEVDLVDQLRVCAGFIPALSLVALDGAQVVGHVMSTRATIGPESRPVLGLGPLGVRADSQRQGVGSALVLATIEQAEEMGEPMIVLLGSPLYYARFGFELADRFGIEPPEPQWAPHFQVRPGRTYDAGARGLFTYAEPFGSL
jgi:putative acetyltransferase